MANTLLSSLVQEALHLILSDINSQDSSNIRRAKTRLFNLLRSDWHMQSASAHALYYNVSLPFVLAILTSIEKERVLRLLRCIIRKGSYIKRMIECNSIMQVSKF